MPGSRSYELGLVSSPPKYTQAKNKWDIKKGSVAANNQPFAKS